MLQAFFVAKKLKKADIIVKVGFHIYRVHFLGLQFC